MLKYLMLLAGCFSLTACYAHDDLYYLRNPDQLQAALAHCQLKSAADKSCQNLSQLSTDFNRLANELRMSPQGFGQSILALQQDLAARQQQLAESPQDKGLQADLAARQKELAYRLAIVKVLEAPEA